jgi:uncharacterized protein (DUF1501 family)
MTMKRRVFLRNSIPAAAIFPAIVDGYSAKAFTGNSPLLMALLNPNIDTDHVLVIVQLNGGNDGLNTVIPIESYGNYYNARQNIAIPQSKILSLTGINKTGFHPAMTGMQTLFNEGKLTVVQSAGYAAPNFSHFRATDIWMSGSDANTVVNSGWAGRYLNAEYPGFPNGYPNSSMPDPLAIQIGSVTSLSLQGPSSSMGISITDPTNFYNLLNGIQDPVPNNYMGDELKFIREVAVQTNQYAARIRDAANTVSRQATYPSPNSLADQLKIVARLIKGGLRTRIYMVSYSGFDNHSLQVNQTDTVTGTHANLLTNLSSAVKAFVDDCKFLDIHERVIGMTFSEFGRRIKSNSSLGTDHGAAAPMFIFGNGVIPGILGSNPSIPANVTVNDNIPFQYDFRSVYASVLQQWFCIDNSNLQSILLKNFQLLNIAKSAGCNNIPNPTGDISLISVSPNPFADTDTVKIQFRTGGGYTLIQLIDALGRVVLIPLEQELTAGTYTQNFSSYGLPSGVYYIRLQNGSQQQVRPIMKVRH